MIKLRSKELLSRIDIYRPSTYDEDLETHSLTRRTNNISGMYYVGYLRNVLGVVKGDNDVHYLEIDVSFSPDYLISDDFRTNDLKHYPERLLGSYYEEVLDQADTYSDDYYEEGMFDSTLRLPFVSFTKQLRHFGNFSLFDLNDNYVSNPNISVELSAVEEYTRCFKSSTGGINFYSDENRNNLGAWIPIGSGYYVKVSDILIKTNTYLKYVKDVSWSGSRQDQIPIIRKIMNLLNEINYTKVEMIDDDGSVNIYPIKKMYNRGQEYNILLNTTLFTVSGGFYHPFLDDTLDIFKFSYVSEPTEVKEVSGIINRSVLEHVFNNADLYMNELRINDKIKLIK